MREPPRLPRDAARTPVRERHALLVNPFYPKDPHASFGKHVLTPYPGTPLFRQFEAEGRLLRRDWSRYDTSHVVFRPRHMTPAQLAEGYAWCYARLFSHASIWRRRPAQVDAVLPYLAMSYLYKRSNRVWEFLIRHRLTHAAWGPLVEWTRRRHLRFRARLEAAPMGPDPSPACVVSAGV